MTTKRFMILGCRFHLIERDGRTKRFQVEQVANGAQRLLANEIEVRIVGVLVVVLAGLLDCLDERRRVAVGFTVALELDQAFIRQARGHLGKRGDMTAADIGFDFRKADTAEP